MSGSSVVVLVRAVIVSVLVLVIVYGTTSSKVKERRARKQLLPLLPDVPAFIEPDRSYRVFLSSALTFQEVRFQGLTSPLEARPQYPPFLLQQRRVINNPDGERVFVKPSAGRLDGEL